MRAAIVAPDDWVNVNLIMFYVMCGKLHVQQLQAAAAAANPPTLLQPLDVAHKLWYHFLYALMR